MTDLRENYKLLCKESIISILNGDTFFGGIEIPSSEDVVPLSLPRLRGRDLFDISTRLGFEDKSNWAGSIDKTRCEYLKCLLELCIEKDKVSELLLLLFSKGQFVGKLKQYTPDVIDWAHKTIVSEAINAINKILYFDDYELKLLGKDYVVVKKEATVQIKAPTVKKIDRDYIANFYERALSAIENKDYDNAIAKCRALLEETFIYVIEKKKETPPEKGDIGKLFNIVKDLYHMHGDKNMDVRFNKLLSGLETIVASISEMRNKNSDAHGVGLKRINIADYHTRLLVNSAVTMAEFILSVCENQIQ